MLLMLLQLLAKDEDDDATSAPSEDDNDDATSAPC
jgi:hypothetical protein